MDNLTLGKMGEALATQHLIKKGYRVLHRNYRFKKSEIDIIVERDNSIVFVEVKLRSSITFGMPESFVNTKKVENIIAAAMAFLEDYPNKDTTVRFDIVAIIKTKNTTQITHFEDAFY